MKREEKRGKEWRVYRKRREKRKERVIGSKESVERRKKRE